MPPGSARKRRANSFPSIPGMVMATAFVSIPLVVRAVGPVLEEIGDDQEQAATTLGAGPVQTFLRVTLPLVAPGIAAGALLAFSLSFDDYIITNFNASPSSITFPMYVWGASARGVPVQVYVIGTVMFLLALIVVMTGQFISSRRNRQVA